MEQFNRVELRGLVGGVRVSHFSDSSVANISVATNYLYTTRDNQANVETTWFNVVARIGKVIEREDSVVKGNAVQASGRFRTRTFTDSDGNERTIYEVVANKLEVLNPDGPLTTATL